MREIIEQLAEMYEALADISKVIAPQKSEVYTLVAEDLRDILEVT